MSLITLSSGKRFEAAADLTLLDAAQQAGISLPYSCKTGRCNTCRCRLVSGSTKIVHAETGLTEQEKADGWILGCSRSAESDLELEVEDLGDIILPPVKTWPCRISRIQHLAPDVVHVFLRLPPSADFQFIPGQYIDIIGPNGVRRSYSLANAPRQDRQLELQIRAVQAGVLSDYWFNQAKENDLLRFTGPQGTFFLRNVASQHVFFLATGTGIAPVKAMLDGLSSMPENGGAVSLTVVWGGRKPEDLYLDLQALYPNVRYVPVLSRAGPEWGGERGYVQQALMKLSPDLSCAQVYACGSDAMIQSARTVLQEAGLSPKAFHSDAFVCSAVS